MGRASRLTPKVQDRVVLAIRAGSSPEGAAQFAGIDRSTFYRWMEQGRAARSGPHKKFREAVEKAKADLETQVAAKLLKAINEGQFEFAIPFLERRYPELWGRRDTVKVEGSEGGGNGSPVRVFLPELHDGAKKTKKDPSEGES
ncbi:MAG: hypothetical protein ACXVEE_35020 [Polyangiales bacterium]